jgi:NADH-quinone oxidoreductase subunit M
MTMSWLIVVPLAGALLAWLLGRWSSLGPRWAALGTLLAETGILVYLCRRASLPPAALGEGGWIGQLRIAWIPQLGITFSLGMDGLSLLMLLLTLLLGMSSVIVSWTSIRERSGFFHLNLLLVLTGIIGVFLALDLFLFYLFWELMLVPMYFLIDLWGHERRHQAAVKFFIFTQAGGLLMLLAILGLAMAHGRLTGEYTFEYLRLLGTPLSKAAELLIMLGFFAAFAVKLPVVPFHTWLPDAHTQAPTAGSVILAGLMLKTGAYGLLRFVLPLFPQASVRFAPLAVALAVIGILYGAVLAFAQRDLKRLIAYTSISHLGFVLLGVFSGSALAWKGAVMQMISHGLSTGALFILAGNLQDQLHTRDMDRLGGLQRPAPRMAAAGLFFALASLGLPGMGNFIGEILVLLGSFRRFPAATVVAAAGLVFATVYALWMIQKVFRGPTGATGSLQDLPLRELAVVGVFAAALLWLGLFPQKVLDTAGSSWASLEPPVGTSASGEKL